MSNVDEFVQKILRADPRALGRAITAVESGGEEGRQILSQIFPRCGRAKLLGITGAPGAGKSTLVDRLASSLAGRGNKVAILAVDPSSPFSGGAVLGDRIRMSSASERGGIYIRSLATRGALGGLAYATRSAVSVLDAAGFDFILIETVGVGQAEVDIVKLADLTAVVVVPGMGDTVQSLKAGILEIADVFILNKADYDGADRLLTELRSLSELTGKAVPIIKTVAVQGEGIEEVTSMLITSLMDRVETGELVRRRRVAAEGLLLERVRDIVVDNIVDRFTSDGRWDAAVSEILNHSTDPESAARALVQAFVGAKVAPK